MERMEKQRMIDAGFLLALSAEAFDRGDKSTFQALNDIDQRVVNNYKEPADLEVVE